MPDVRMRCNGLPVLQEMRTKVGLERSMRTDAKEVRRKVRKYIRESITKEVYRGYYCRGGRIEAEEAVKRYEQDLL